KGHAWADPLRQRADIHEAPGEYNPRMRHSLSRRDFLQVTGAGALVSLGAPRLDTGSSPRVFAPTQGDAGPGWFDRPMRWVQLTLVENDPGRFDPQFLLGFSLRLS